MVRSDYAGWLSININSTVDGWMRRPQRGSYGLDVTVIDPRTQQHINPRDVFQFLDCNVRTDDGKIVLCVHYRQCCIA